MSLLAVLDSVWSLRNEGRDAETTMRAAPACSSGTEVFPIGRVTRRWLPSISVTVAPPAAPSVKIGVLWPFCSSAIEIDQKDYLALLASALGEGGGGASTGGVSAAGPVEFEALDRLLETNGREAGAAVPPSGWVIAQLLGQTS